MKRLLFGFLFVVFNVHNVIGGVCPSGCPNGSFCNSYNDCADCNQNNPSFSTQVYDASVTNADNCPWACISGYYKTSSDTCEKCPMKGLSSPGSNSSISGCYILGGTKIVDDSGKSFYLYHNPVFYWNETRQLYEPWNP